MTMSAETKSRILKVFDENKVSVRFMLQLNEIGMLLHKQLALTNAHYGKSYTEDDAEMHNKKLISLGLVTTSKEHDAEYLLTEDGVSMKDTILRGAEKRPARYRKYTRPSYSPTTKTPTHERVPKAAQRATHVSM